MTVQIFFFPLQIMLYVIQTSPFMWLFKSDYHCNCIIHPEEMQYIDLFPSHLYFLSVFT